MSSWYRVLPPSMIVSPGSSSVGELGDRPLGDLPGGHHHPHRRAAPRARRPARSRSPRRSSPPPREPATARRRRPVPTQRCPSRINRRTRFAPMRPRPTIPSCIGVSVAIAPPGFDRLESMRVYETRRGRRPHGRRDRHAHRQHRVAGARAPPRGGAERASAGAVRRRPGPRRAAVRRGRRDPRRSLEAPRRRPRRSPSSSRWREERGVAARRDAMFRGEHVNRSEDRPALHVALRMPRTALARRRRP